LGIPRAIALLQNAGQVREGKDEKKLLLLHGILISVRENSRVSESRDFS